MQFEIPEFPITFLPGQEGRFPQTPLTAMGELRREKVVVEGRTFQFIIPEKSDKMLEHPEVRATFQVTDFLPYWGDLWPAGRMLAKAILRESWPAEWLSGPERPEVVEIGCGLGLPGLAALSLGMRVIFTDYDLTALRLAGANAHSNRFEDFRLLALDWTAPPVGWQVPLLLASDLTYEVRHVEPIVRLIQTMLAPDGLCLLTDQDRMPAGKLRTCLTESGLHFSTQMLRAGEPGGERHKGTLYRIRHAARAT